MGRGAVIALSVPDARAAHRARPFADLTASAILRAAVR